MKKYSILLLLAALSGCSLLPSEMLSKEFIAENIDGKTIPAALNNKTLVYGYTDMRLTNGYISFKSEDNPYDTFAAKIVKIDTATADHYKLFISDGSKEKGKLRVNALYITNAGNNIYGYGLSYGVDINAPFPKIYDSSSLDSSEDKIYVEWAVDEAHKPTTLLPTSHQGTYKSMWGDSKYKVSAVGITEEYSSYTSSEEKFLRVVVSGTDYLCYTANSAYKITASEIFRGSPPVGTGYNPATNITLWDFSIATRP